LFDDINDVYWAHELMVNDVLDKHIPVKQKVQRRTRAPFMNSQLRKAINHKKALFRKFHKYKTDQNWRAFKKQRNFTTKLKRQSIRLYFADRCGGGTKSKSFWPTIKPFLSNKTTGASCLQLIENDKLILAANEVSEVFNNFFVNVAKDIGDDSPIYDNTCHPSIDAIKKNCRMENSTFAFETIDEIKVKKYIGKIATKKSTGVDNIPPKILRLTSDVLARPITNIVNRMLSTNQFPDQLKMARIYFPYFQKRRPPSQI
jgi:hypothetical protein